MRSSAPLLMRDRVALSALVDHDDRRFEGAKDAAPGRRDSFGKKRVLQLPRTPFEKVVFDRAVGVPMGIRRRCVPGLGRHRHSPLPKALFAGAAMPYLR
jgi:hypothetical protein